MAGHAEHATLSLFAHKRHTLTMTPTSPSANPPVTRPPLEIRQVVQAWWPLALSWGIMACEIPAVTATISRLPDPKTNLAAFGGIVFPVTVVISAPIMLMLGASTALSKDWDSFIKLRRFMMGISAALTALHMLAVLTPAYEIIAGQLLGAPEPIAAAARPGLAVLIPWTWSLAYRRFHQGLLIRFGRSHTVTIGTVLRLFVIGSTLLTGFFFSNLPGIIVGPAALSAGVMAEAAYAGVAARPIISGALRLAPALEVPLTFHSLVSFYTPLALTGLLNLLIDPIASAAFNRMPDNVDSLAAWPVVGGVLFFFRTLGIAYNEVVISLMDEPQAIRPLRRFTNWITAGSSAVYLLVILTPLVDFWLNLVIRAPVEILPIVRVGLVIAAGIPAISVLQSWYQGLIMHSRRTRGITEAVVLYLCATAIVLAAGVAWGRITGLYVGWAAFSIAGTLQVAWLWYRSRPARQAARAFLTEPPGALQVKKGLSAD